MLSKILTAMEKKNQAYFQIDQNSTFMFQGIHRKIKWYNENEKIHMIYFQH